MLRLQSASDFERVRRDGRSHAHPLAVLITCRRPPPPDAQAGYGLPQTRCGFTAGKGVGGAIARNRAKRLLREAVRARANDLAPGWDLVFIARAALAKATLNQAQEAVNNLLRRADVIKTNG